MVNTEIQKLFFNMIGMRVCQHPIKIKLGKHNIPQILSPPWPNPVHATDLAYDVTIFRPVWYHGCNILLHSCVSAYLYKIAVSNLKMDKESLKSLEAKLFYNYGLSVRSSAERKFCVKPFQNYINKGFLILVCLHFRTQL